MKLFITGGTGLVGSHLLAHCVMKNIDVVALRREGSRDELLEYVFAFYGLVYKRDGYCHIRWVYGELEDCLFLRDAMSGCNVVIHCAADVGLGGVDDEKMEKVNVQYTGNIIEASKLAGIKKLCYLSSIAALGTPTNGETINEDSLWKEDDVHSTYARTKHEAMIAVIRASDENMSTVSVCPGPILGVSCYDKGSSQILYLAKKGVPFATKGGSGYVDVRDVCRVLLMLSERKYASQKYVLVSENLSNLELLRMFSRGFRKISPIAIPKPMIYFAAYFAEFIYSVFSKKPQLDRNMARTITHRSYYSSKRIENEMNFNFIPIKKCVEDICNYMKK